MSEESLSEGILNLENDLGLKIKQDTREVQGINIGKLFNLNKEKLQEFLSELKEEIEPLRYDIRIDQASRLIKAIDKLALKKFGKGILK